MVKNNYFLFSIIFVILCLGFVFAVHTSYPASITLNQSQNYFFNITINNTNVGHDGNITQINITLPSGFSFITATNGTNIANTPFSNTSSILMWTNGSGFLINGSTNNKYFWFNATASSVVGYYNISVASSNVTTNHYTNVSIRVSDITSPYNFTLISPSPADGANISQSTIVINASAVDNVNISTFRFYLFNSTGLINNTNVSSYLVGVTSYASINFTNLADTTYFYNVTVNDTVGNENITGQSRRFTLDTNGPVITLLSPASATSATTSAYSFTFTVTGPIKVESCVLMMDDSIIHSLTSISMTSTNEMYNSSLSVATHSWYIQCTDTFAKTGTSSTYSLTVLSSTGGSSGSSSSESFWTSSAIATADQLTAGINIGLKSKGRLRFSIDSINHHVGVVSLSNSSVTVSVSSTPQQKVMSVGDEWKVDVTNDNYADISVKLTSVLGDQANFTIKSIHELITVTTPQSNNSVTTSQGNTTSSSDNTKKLLSSSTFWVIVIVIIVVIVLIALIWVKLIKRK